MCRFPAAVTIWIMAALPDVAVAADPVSSLFSSYCTACHNERLKTAGLVLDKADVTQMPANSELWHRTIFDWLAEYLK